MSKRTETIEILRSLRDGRDPRDGSALDTSHLCQSGDVVRALFEAVIVLETAAGSRPLKAAPRAIGAKGDPTRTPHEDETVELPAVDLAKATVAARSRAPNAGQPWKVDDDARLVVEFEGGATVRQLATSFGRSVNSVRSRLLLLSLGDRLPPGPAPRFPVHRAAGAATPEAPAADVSGERSAERRVDVSMVSEGDVPVLVPEDEPFAVTSG